MANLVCTWLLIFGLYYNTYYIKSIQPKQRDVWIDIATSVERPCLPYLETGPCYRHQDRRIYNGTDDVYVVTIANTESGGDTEYVYDKILTISNFREPQEYTRITDYIKRCINIQS